MMKKTITIFIFGILLSCSDDLNKLQLNSLFSDNMVLQRNTLANIWGKGIPNKRVTIIADWGEKVTLKCSPDSIWNSQLKTPEAGGPYSIVINSIADTVKINNVMIGELWLASGQSNMEMSLKGFPPNELILNSKNEILSANYPNIRMFNVKRSIELKPSNKLSGSWIKTSPDEVKNFSATAYFFAREIHKNLNIPIGIIHSSWGGTPAEAWTSKTKLRDLELFTETLKNIEKSESQNTIDKWFEKFNSTDIPQESHSKGVLKDYYKNLNFSDDKLSEIELNDQSWQNVILPGRFDTLKLEQFDGVIWLRKEIFLDDIYSDYKLNIGYIDDMDKTYFNNNLVGDFSGYGYHKQRRSYNVPKSILKKGRNIIAIRAIDIVGDGEFGGQMNLTNNSGEIISIEGVWRYKPVAEIYENKIYTYETRSSTVDRPSFVKLNPYLPEVLFNGMINPLIPFTIKGAIWYQGESNVGRHDQYSTLFPGMIEDWRSRWGNEFPFYYVQIAPFRYTKDPSNNVSQKLREAQRKTLELPNTGMVVTLDIGDFENIHPSNKQEVGKRLARIALANDYKVGFNPSGPIFKNGKRLNNLVRLNFDHVVDGLVHLKNKNNQFKVAGIDNQFYKGNVLVNRDHILISSDLIKNPKYVSYAWSDTPEATLFNSDGLPASSFMIEVD
jgi:sialate O-acetylesterase